LFVLVCFSGFDFEVQSFGLVLGLMIWEVRRSDNVPLPGR
jgi:hypothetical protein